MTIRADYCIALRMIALQEYHRRQEEYISEFYHTLLDSQESLGEEFERVLFNNIEELYVED